MNRRHTCRRWLFAGALASAAFAAVQAAAPVSQRPNIIVILGDDIGYGDFGCYGATRIKTPNIDQLAGRGVLFTDAYAPAATCTPTRFGLLTGTYAWRQPGTQVLSGNAPLIIKKGVPTIPSLLQQGGYATGVVGKWHLGLGRGDLNFNKEIGAGPRTVGFDYSFIVPATGDRVPCVYVENHRTVNLDPADPIRVSYKDGQGGSKINGIRRIGSMTGGKSALWKDEAMADTLTGKAVSFIKAHKDQPFFLYLATHDAHSPLVPHPRFLGSSQAGKRGDAVQSFDATVGEVVKTLNELGLAGNTMIIVTSDNGGYPGHVAGYSPNGPLRGFKATAFEGGVRVPFIVSWPAKIRPGKSRSLLALTDLLATTAAAAGLKLPDRAGPDSINQLPVFLDPSISVRNDVVMQYTYQSGPSCPRSIRAGKWKLIPAGKRVDQDLLFDLEADASEKKNVAGENKDAVTRLKTLLKRQS